MTHSPQKTPGSSQESGPLVRTWTVQIPHPLEGLVKCYCEASRNTARLFMSRTDTNPERQFFRCPNQVDEKHTECRYFSAYLSLLLIAYIRYSAHCTPKWRMALFAQALMNADLIVLIRPINASSRMGRPDIWSRHPIFWAQLIQPLHSAIPINSS